MKKKLTNNAGAPVVDNQNTMTAGKRGPALLQDVWFLEKLAHFDREVIPERRMHAKGSGAYGTFTVTKDITCESQDLTLQTLSSSVLTCSCNFLFANSPKRCPVRTEVDNQAAGNLFG